MSWFDDFDWKTALKTVAPTVASIFGTPLAGAGVRVLLDAIFPDEDHSTLPPEKQEEKLADALKSGLSPEQIAAMKQADYAFQQRIAELDLEGLKVDAADRDSARKREMTVKDRVPAILASVTSFGFFVTLGCLFFVVPPEKNSEIIYLLVGQGIVATYLMIYNYYFGSSSGSKSKTDAFERITTAATRKKD